MKPIKLILLLWLVLTLGCVKTVPMPSALPQPLKSYKVIFTGERSQSYSQSPSDPYPPLKMSYSLMNGPVKIVRDEQISRPYIKIGTMVFTKNWYDDETIANLIRLHVPQTGGDAVLSYHMDQESTAVMKDQITGKIRNLYYGTINLEIIGYTDK